MLSLGLPSHRGVTALLFAPGMAYRAAVRLRNALYDSGCLTSRRLPCPVISIGNLTIGGTGKTPITSFVAGMLSDSGYRVGVLSRGYRRRSGRGPLLVSDGRSLLADAQQAGDEPFLIARANPSIGVAVGADRLQAAGLLFSVMRPEVVVLDDAFQHRPIARDLDIVLVDGRDPWGNGRMIPLGPLREPPSALARADALVVTRSQGACPPELSAAIERHNPRSALFHGHLEPDRFVDADGTTVDRASLRGFSAYAFSGIARPARFEEDLQDSGVRLLGSRRFPDHHAFRPRDLQEISATARSLGADVLMTTEKDIVRIAHRADSTLPLFALRLRVRFTGRPDFSDHVLDRLRDLQPRRSRRSAS